MKHRIDTREITNANGKKRSVAVAASVNYCILIIYFPFVCSYE